MKTFWKIILSKNQSYSAIPDFDFEDCKGYCYCVSMIINISKYLAVKSKYLSGLMRKSNS